MKTFLFIALFIDVLIYLVVRGGTMNKTDKERADDEAEEIKCLKELEEKRKNRENKKARKKNI